MLYALKINFLVTFSEIHCEELEPITHFRTQWLVYNWVSHYLKDFFSFSLVRFLFFLPHPQQKFLIIKLNLKTCFLITITIFCYLWPSFTIRYTHRGRGMYSHSDGFTPSCTGCECQSSKNTAFIDTRSHTD